MACTYILFSESTQKFYTGSSHDKIPTQRLKNHNSNKVRSTKNGKPWILIYTEQYQTYTEARKSELFLKSGCGRKWVNKHFIHYKK